MTYYGAVKIVFLAVTILIPAYLVFLKRENVIISLFSVFLCFASTFSHDFELFGVVNLQQILLVLIAIFGMNRLDATNLRQNELKKNIYIYII